MTLADLSAALVTFLGAQLASAGKFDVGDHGGRFGAQDLQRYSARAPSVRVACLGVRSTELRGGLVLLDTTWAAYVITRSTAALDRHAQAQALVQTLLTKLSRNDWADDASDVRNLRADNLYAGEIDKRGVALWAVTWQQTLGVNYTDDSVLDDFKLLHADTDIAPADSQIDISQDTQIPQP